MDNDKSTPAVFYGWKVVSGILVVLTFAAGLGFYNHAVILNALARQGHFSVESASVAVSLFFVSAGINGLWVARLLARYDVRLCITAGAIVSGLSLAALSEIDSVVELCVIYIFFGLGFAAAGLLPCTTLVARWFHKKRALALSVASTGLSLGGVVITPFSAALVDAVGLPTAAPFMGIAYVLGVVPITWMLVRPSPASMGMGVDGSPMPDAAQAARPVEGISFAQAGRHRFFWGVCLAYIFLMMAQVGAIAHQYGLVNEIMTGGQKALVLAIVPVASIVGRLLGGWILGSVSIRGFAVTTMALQLVSLMILAVSSGIATLFIGLIVFGISVGNLLMLQPLLIAEAFGLRAYSEIFSVANLLASLGTAFGPAILGFAYAFRESYSLPYAIAATAAAIGLLLFVTAGPVSGARKSVTH